jgi:pSer/pThr/pTyr-binding forkhead associated (FHA) protein
MDEELVSTQLADDGVGEEGPYAGPRLEHTDDEPALELRGEKGTVLSAGRTENNDFVLRDHSRAESEQRVSGKHAELRRLESGWVLENFGKNGTLLNGVRVAKGMPTPLLDGDSVLFAGSEVYSYFSYVVRGVGKVRDDMTSDQRNYAVRALTAMEQGAARAKAAFEQGDFKGVKQASGGVFTGLTKALQDYERRGEKRAKEQAQREDERGRKQGREGDHHAAFGTAGARKRRDGHKRGKGGAAGSGHGADSGGGKGRGDGKGGGKSVSYIVKPVLLY